MIEVRTCARLHLGLLDHSGERGRMYGSIGLAVNHPQLVLRAEESENLVVEGLEQDRISTYAQRFIRHYGLPAGVRLTLAAGIPAHVGLGSGTQIALAVGTALTRLAGLHVKTEEIAVAMGRGLRSGIGIATFQHGGFVLDGGHPVLETADSALQPSQRHAVDHRIPPILFRNHVPRDWYFVTAIPGTGQGISGECETRAFSRLPQAPPELADKISWMILMKMMPALIEKDIVGFGEAMTGIQQMVGDCFASVQGGRYSNPLSGRLIEYMLGKGAVGAGQSSWGPAVYGLIYGREAARKLLKDVQCFFAGNGGGQAFCVQTRNRGALIRQGNPRGSRSV
jgi:beta-ribofuranosylaminobenzene 5'-phosphate synthase